MRCSSYIQLHGLRGYDKVMISGAVQAMVYVLSSNVYSIMKYNDSFAAELNDVKWSAYRTAMKLRCIQKAACCKYTPCSKPE